MGNIDKVVLDLDGTLVDSVYVHVLAWHAAFGDVGLQVPGTRLHRLIGMGGDRLVAAAAGEVAERALGDEIRSRHQANLDRLFSQITPTAGALDLLEALHERGIEATVASSGDQELTERLLDVVPGARRLLAHVVTGSDAEESKPDGELVATALGETAPDRTLMVGDAVWDVRAAHEVGVRCLGVLTGGISSSELLEAGAVAVVDDAAAIAARLRDSGGLPGTD